MESGEGMSRDIVLESLRRASSQDTHILKPAEQQLKQWETQPGFYVMLMSVVGDYDMDVNIRFMAVLYFKNGVERYWRKNAPNAIKEEEKDLLRQRLVQHFYEPYHQIAVQLSVLVAKIARQDVPRQWPELIPSLLEAVRHEDIMVQQRALLTLYHVIKTLASKRLSMDRKVFEELTANIFAYILESWKTHSERAFTALNAHDHNVLVSLDHSILSLKVLRRLAVFGLAELDKKPEGMQFIEMVFQHIEHFLKAKPNMINRELMARREKALTTLTKVLMDLQENQPLSFIPFIERSLQMTVRFAFTEEGKDLLYERFTVNILNLMRAILRCEYYRPSKKIYDEPDPRAMDAHSKKQEFFNSATLTEICKRLIQNYFPFKSDDLEQWDSDPEAFVSEDGGDSWKFSLRPCIDDLYMTLMKEYRDTLAPVIISLVQQYQGPVPPEDLSAILLKDAVYNAVGQSSFDLHDDVDFDSWLTSSLIPELQITHPNYRIVRRRIIWLLGCWTGVKLSQQLRPTLYSTLVPLLAPTEDLVLRIEAALSLKICVDDFEFSSEQFLPFLEASIGGLFQLLKDVEECETKMQILHVMSFIIERMRIEVRPHASALISYLPALWEESADHNMLRCAILTTLMFLVQGLGSLCVSMYDFLLPAISHSVDVDQEPHVYLGEDGLELWHATLHASPSITPGLLQLYTHMPKLLDLGTETQLCLKITESYILLGGREFLQAYGESLFKSLTSMLNDLRAEGIVMVLKVVELIMKVFPQEGPVMFASMLPDILKAFVFEHEYPLVVSVRLALFCRIILQNQQFFWQILDKMAAANQTLPQDILADFLNVWFEKMDNVIQPERKKLSALALAALINSNAPAVLDRFGGLINLIVEALHDVCRTDSETGQEVDYLLSGEQEDLPPDELETEHDKRKRQLAQQDPIYSVNLREFTLQQLTICRQQQGEEQFARLMELVDVEIVQQLDSFMKQGAEQGGHATGATAAASSSS